MNGRRGELPGRLVLLGAPVAHSLSPRFQNAALREAGVPLTYEALHVAPEALDGVLAALRLERAAGNVTVPHKEAVAARCDRLTPLAARVGAVNTFWVEGGALVGDNTDVGGFEQLVRLLGIDLVGARVAVLGAGGAAAAVLVAVARWPGAAARLQARDPARARRLAARLGGSITVCDSAVAAIADATLVVNATPIGLHDDRHPLALDLLPAGAAVADLVYREGETAWVRAARHVGHPALDGLPMLVEQGALAFERWLGIPPDRDVMRAAVAAAG